MHLKSSETDRNSKSNFNSNHRVTVEVAQNTQYIYQYNLLNTFNAIYELKTKIDVRNPNLN